jgi:stage V sporulation protein R
VKESEYARFECAADELEVRAQAYGLDFFPMRYELCPADVVYSIAGFGMPARFSHWSFGKHYYRQKLDFDFGMSRIYELVVNNDPCYAFFLDSNTILQNETIIAHVLGHSDFFKNNSRFSNTNRHMVETMSATAARFREYEEQYGIDTVEEIIDAAMAIAEHVDPYGRAGSGAGMVGAAESRSKAGSRGRSSSTGALGREGMSGRAPAGSQYTSGPTGSTKNTGKLDTANRDSTSDLIQFILLNNPSLADWEQDILSSIREEMLYFWPQIETKIMNEGWATYWHNLLMEERDLSVEDALDFAKMTASVSSPNPFHLNPYNVGLEIWKDIEKRYGREEMFVVRECDSDISFIRNYLNQDIVDTCNLYLYEKRGNEWVITEKDYKVIRDKLVAGRIHGGFPVLNVSSADNGRGTLLLTHAFEGIELDAKYIEKTLPHVSRLWGRDVRLQTTIGEKTVEFQYDGKVTQRI